MPKKKRKWLALYRDIFNHWIGSRNDWLVWWIKMIAEAAEQDEVQEIGRLKVAVRRGQFVTTGEELMNLFGCGSRHTVLNFLKKLVGTEMCTDDVHTKYRVITICNYDTYQFPTGEGVHTTTAQNPAQQGKENKEKKQKKIKKIEETAVSSEKRKNPNAVNACAARSSLRDSFFKKLAEDLEVRKDICGEFGFKDMKTAAVYLGGFMGHIIERQPNKKWKSFDDFVKHCKNWIGKQNEAGAKENLKAYTKWLREQKATVNEGNSKHR